REDAEATSGNDLEDELRRTKQALRDMAEERTRWVATISHEIRNSMATLLGASAILAEETRNGDRQELSDVLKRSGETVLTLLADLIELAKIDAGRLPRDVVEFDLGAFVEDLARDLAARDRSPAVELVCRLSEDLPRRVLGDPMRMHQVLLNIAGNALKFTAEGEVAVHAVRDDSTKADTVRFTISDTGPGIAPDELARLFEPFASIGSPQRRIRGHGLGLSIAKQIVDQDGGSIEVASALGRGTTFTIRVPLPAAAGGRNGISLVRANARVLVIEDRAGSSSAVAETLRSWGAVVVEVDDGVAGLAGLYPDCDRYDVVMLDVRIRNPGCFELLERMREQPAAVAKSIVILPMRHRADDPARLRALGVAGWVLTPIKQAELEAALNVVLSRA
ncbi:MAG: hybrid sensor histidine kinase/response regulator, partial [Candidatus Binatia bacterium]